MKIQDLIDNFKKNPKYQEKVYIGDIFGEFSYDEIYDYSDQVRLTSYYIANWHCTDSQVGFKLYFFDDKPVAFTSQLGRKCDENFQWFSREDYLAVREFVESFREDRKPQECDIISLDEELGDDYQIDYFDQIYKEHATKAILNGEDVELVMEKQKYGRGFITDDNDTCLPKTIKIKRKDDKEEFVLIKDLRFKFNDI